MAHLEDLKAVIQETLERRGVLDALRGKIRAEVFKTLDDKASIKPRPNNDTILINELIREYLSYNKYNYAAMTLEAESGQGQPLGREFLESELNMKTSERNRAVPLLYHLLNAQKETASSTELRLKPRIHGQRNIVDDSFIPDDPAKDDQSD